MRILLTGATGFIGSWLIPCLRHGGHEVSALVRSSTQTVQLERMGVPVVCDDGVGDMQETLQRQDPFDGVIHLASLFRSSHHPDEVSPLLLTNVLFPTRLLDACVRCGIQWFLNTGTTWQHFENRRYAPVNLYAATKQAFETVAQYYVEAHGVRLVTLALGDTYGPGDSRPKLLNLWCQIAQTGSPLNMSEGTQEIDLVYVSDVVEAFRLAAELLADGEWPGIGAMPTFGVSSGSSLSLRDLARLFEDVSGRVLPIRWGARPLRQREVMKPWISADSVPGWTPKIALREGLGRLWTASQCYVKD